MSTLELFILAIGLSMDAFAVAVCRGIAVKRATTGHIIEAGVYFGGFQAAMPLIGYFVGYRFADAVNMFDHWIAFILLGYLGINMLRSSFDNDLECAEQSMLTLAIATSIDALAVGVSLAFMQIDIFTAVIFIGAITFMLSCMGVKLGSSFGDRYKSKAELIGGLILIGMGGKILFENLFL